jgi:hypothetical protein
MQQSTPEDESEQASNGMRMTLAPMCSHVLLVFRRRNGKANKNIEEFAHQARKRKLIKILLAMARNCCLLCIHELASEQKARNLKESGHGSSIENVKGAFAIHCSHPSWLAWHSGEWKNFSHASLWL